MWRRRRARAAPLSGKFPFFFFRDKRLEEQQQRYIGWSALVSLQGKKRAAEDNKISEKQRDVGWCASLLRVDNTDKISLVTASPIVVYTTIYCKYWKPWKGLLLVTYQMSAVFNEAWRESRGRSRRVRSSLSEFDRGKQRIKLKKCLLLLKINFKATRIDSYEYINLKNRSTKKVDRQEEMCWFSYTSSRS